MRNYLKHLIVTLSLPVASISYANCISGTSIFDTVGEHLFVVPDGCEEINVKTWGAGGGGTMAEPWGTSNGGDGGFVEANVQEVTPGQSYRVIVGGGGRHSACGDGTPGAGGGGHSSLLTMGYGPIVSAGGGGGAQFYTDPCHGGETCASISWGAGGMGYGGGGMRSDDSGPATNGMFGEQDPSFEGGIQGLYDCGNDEGKGGYGGGGGGGGTHNGFGGGGGGGGYPGGAGGVSGNAGHGGSNFIDVIIASMVVSNSNGASGGIGENDGEPGKVVISWGEGANTLLISPPSGSYVTSQNFDISLIVEGTNLSLTGAHATLDGSDVTSFLDNCAIPGTLVSGGMTLRCPNVTGGMLGVGSHTLEVTLDFDDNVSVRDTVMWEVMENLE